MFEPWKEQIKDPPETFSVDSARGKAHADGTGARTKEASQSIGKFRGSWTTKIPMLAAAKDRQAGKFFSLSSG